MSRGSRALLRRRVSPSRSRDGDGDAWVRGYVGAVFVAAAGLAAAVMLLDAWSFERPWLSAAVAALVMLENALSVRLRRRDQGEALAHEEALIVFAALLLSPASALVAFAVGVVAGQLVLRLGPLKTVFNVAQFVGSAALALLVVGALAPAGESDPPRAALAAVAGALVFAIVNQAAVAGVMALTGAASFRAGLRSALGATAIVWSGAVSIGVLAALTALVHAWALPFAVAAMVVLSVAFSGHIRALRERQGYKELLRSAGAGIVSVDRGGRVRVWNPEMERITGVAAEDAAGTSLAALFHVDAASESATDLLSTSVFGEPGERAIVRVGARSGERRLSVSRTPLPDGGLAFVAQDVTEQHEAEEAVRDSERRLRLALEAGDMGCWEWDILSDSIHWSEDLERLNGLPAGAFGGTFADFLATIHPEDRDRVAAETDVAFADGRSEIVYRIARPDGSVRWIEDLGKVITDDAGRPVKMIGVQRDVTERKRAEALSELQQRVLVKVAAGEPLEAVLASLLVLVEEQSEGVLASVLLRDADGAVDRRAPVLEHGLSACWSTPLIASSGDVLGTFAMYQREPRPPATADLELGEVASHLAGIAIERARQEERLVTAEERYRRLVEQLPLGVYVFTPADTETELRGRAGYINPQIEAMLGYSAREWEEDPDLYSRILHPEDRARVDAEVRRARAHGSRFREEYRMVAKDGRIVWVHDESVYLRDDDGRLGSVEGFLLDVSERKALEAGLLQAQKMDAVGRLAGGIAHDFNNLMGAVIGFGELVLGRLDEDDAVRPQVAQMVRAGERAAAMTNQLLAFSRKQMLRPRPLDLNAVVADSEKLLGRLLGEDVELACALDPGLEPILADPVQLEQVIMNLAVNARDAMPTGGKLTIETANVELDAEYGASHFDVEPGSYVMLAVSDTGVGMDAETRSRIFEPFFTTKEEGKGTGLGLATVFGIVKQTGGDVSVYSEPGHGTTFKLYLPRAERRAEPESSAPPRSDLARGSETILLVEDERLVRELEREVLQQCGYVVLEAEQPRQAIEIAAAHEGRIDLLLTDVVMPGMSGRELAERLGPVRPEMKVIYASGYSDDSVVRHGVLEAEVAFLTKPFPLAALAAKVREVLDGDGRSPGYAAPGVPPGSDELIEALSPRLIAAKRT